MVEYHVDTIPQFLDIADKSVKKGKFGGCLGARINIEERPVNIFGHYEAIFKQFIFTEKICDHKGKFQHILKSTRNMAI